MEINLRGKALLHMVQDKKKRRHSKRKKTILEIGLIVIFLALAGVGAYAGRIYYDVNHTAQSVYKKKNKSIKNLRGQQAIHLDGQKPFSILLLGTDTGALGRKEQGRTDSMILATVNPQTKQTKMLSIARDSRVKIARTNKLAKINSAYEYGGVSNTINTVQNFLDVPVDYYVLLNMRGIEQLVSAVGGVKVNNKFTFNYEGKHFPKGVIYLNGADALKYSRMRYSDPDNDFGRQRRQQQIIQAVLKKAVSLNMLTHYNEFLTAMQDNLQTNLTLKDVLSIQKKYRKALNFQTLQLRGHGQMIDGQSYQVMDAHEVSAVTQTLKQQLNLK